jgi:CubicO group peptidase (beta-lactamase class C family)/D-alanyl-D-alanine dipeptidase
MASVVLTVILLSYLVQPTCRPSALAASRESNTALVIEELERVIEHEMEDKQLPALSIALVDDQKTVWAKAFGLANPEKKIPATVETVYRVGSVSKLFTDIGIMQLVERGEIDLDAPVTRYLPDFQPRNPFDKPITLRQLMSHRSGLVREPPVGHYFDPTEPSLAETVNSLNATELVYEPGTRMKYSNAAVSVVGYVLERTQKQPFARYLKQAVLEPMGLGQSAFEPDAALLKNLARASMWTYDGRVFDAPTFQLGTSPAGSLYTTITDMARFLSILLNGAKGPKGQVLKPETLEQMYKPQFAPPGQRGGFGLGFLITNLGGYRRIGHGGAVYGFATELAALPEAKLGVAVVTTMDTTNAVVTRIADHALRLMLATRKGQPLPKMEFTRPVDPALTRRLKGRYVSGDRTIDLVEREGRLFMTRRDLLVELKSLGEKLVVDDRLADDPVIAMQGDQLGIDKDTFTRVPTTKPEPVPARWEGLIGEYGWDHNTLYVLEKDGQLHALIEWFFDYSLKEITETVFAFPNFGLFHGEKLTFKRGSDGRATELVAGSVEFTRRPVGTEEGATFRLTPVRPVDQLRKMALAAPPPKEAGEFRPPDLVDLSTLDPTIKFDIRYATTNNFMSTVFYKQAKAFLQKPAAEALLRAHQRLKQHGYGLLIHDAYRPWYVTKMFWDATPEDKKIFVADPAKGSRHNRGAAVDLTLYDLKTGQPIRMTGGYDEFSPRSYAHYPGGTSLQRWRRDLLREAMEAQGFTVYPYEWWHFDYQDWQQYPILNRTFERIHSAHQRQ